MNKTEESFGPLQWPRSIIRPESGTLCSSHATGIEGYLLFSFYYKLEHAIQNPRLLNNNNNNNIIIIIIIIIKSTGNIHLGGTFVSYSTNILEI